MIPSILSGTKPKIHDVEALWHFAQAHGHFTAQPEEIGDATIGKALKRIQFARKSGATHQMGELDETGVTY